jgi:hypothetical protein
MKRKFWLLAIVGAVLLSVAPVLADDGFYVIGGGGKVGTPINSLPCIISLPGMYYLNGNLTYAPTSGNAITVSANDVTLDLMGFCLTGPGKTSGTNYGISINVGINNMEIRNGSVKSFGGSGIYAANNAGIRVIGLRVSDNGAYGVRMVGNDHVVIGCLLLNNGSTGASVASGIIKGNHVVSNGAFGLSASQGSTISGNLCRFNSSIGILASAGSTVVDNTVMNSGGTGINTSDGCTVTRNTSRGNSGVGIATGDNCLIINNTTQGLTNGSTGCIVLENVSY